ncbi:MAG TPA: carboxypeptidase regulatory-like domain-containing protein, partial [Polyangia bacterium]|nr:carboxypeptidase regulatory-like domain-containing protein [Polyangia bacterium]
SGGGGLAGAAGSGAGGSGGGLAGGGGSAGAGGSAGVGGGCTTSVSGTIFDPAGVAPVYRAHVYAPSTTLEPVPEGISCTTCGVPLAGQPIADTVTDVAGHFKLVGAPAGSNVPLVIQLGKWRRQITVPTVAACTDTALADTTRTRLPRDSSEGHLPRIAVVTGHAGAIECWLRKLGVSDSEFSPQTGTGRVHLFVGGAGMTLDEGAQQMSSGATFTDAYTSLFADPTALASYDMVLLACEGEQLESEKDPYLANLKAYADGGGRVLAEHLQSYWIRRGPDPWPATGVWLGVGTDPPTPLTATLDTGTADGIALADWMSALGAATDDQLSVTMPQNSLQSVVAPARQWLFAPLGTGPSSGSIPLLMTFATPVEATPGPQCGSVAFADLHVDVGDVSHPEVPFPQGCTSTAAPSPQERLLEFLLFDTPTCGPPP